MMLRSRHIIFFLSLFSLLFLIWKNNKNKEGRDNFISQIFSEIREVNDPDEDGTYSLQDRMDLVWEQEYERTKDPALGYVPTDRLLLANKVLLQKRAARKSVLKTTASIAGINWTERGPKNQGGRTRAILVDLNDATRKTVFAGSVGGGLWKTTDITFASPIWNPINDFMSNLAITALVQDPTNYNIIYAATGEGYGNVDGIRGIGIFKSVDGGTTWAQLPSTNNTTFNTIRRLGINSNGTLFASTSNGLRKSTDGGSTWTKVLGSGMGITGAASNTGYDVEVASNGIIYASLRGSIHKSTDGGNTFSSAFTLPVTGLRIELAVANTDPNSVYALMETSTGSAIIKSTDGGNTWASTTSPTDAGGGTDFTNGQAWYDLAIEVDPNNATTLYVGGLDLFKSTNGASSWTQLSHWYGGFGFPNVHADQHIIYFEPGNSSVIYFGNDGGIYRYNAGFSYKGNNYRTTQFYGCAVHPTSGSNVFLAGAQDNGSHFFNGSGIVTTTRASGGDGAFCHIDQDEPQYMFTQYIYNQYFRSTNGGSSFSNAGNALNFSSSAGQFINPTDYDNVGNDMYGAHNAGNYFLWADAPTSNSSTNVSIAAFGTGKITTVTCSDAVSGKVWFGLNNAKVIRVENAASVSPTATDLSQGLPTSGSVSCIAFEPNNENHLLVTYSNYGVNSIWESTNGGTTWFSIEGDLPDMPVRWALFNPVNGDQALIATELGVWSTDNINGTNTDWQPSNSGLANVRTDMLQYRKSDRLIIAATHGRGLFSAIIPVPTPVSLGDFRADIVDQNIQLSWITFQEENTRSFEIERSDNGIDFFYIGSVNGADHSSIMRQYKFIDKNLNAKFYYYRLKQINYDGSYFYSDVVTVELNDKDSFKIIKLYPNPAEVDITLILCEILEEGTDVFIYDMNGREVQHAVVASRNKEFNVSINQLPRGSYHLLLRTGTKSAFSRFQKL